jgi:hypothetical protein
VRVGRKCGSCHADGPVHNCVDSFPDPTSFTCTYTMRYRAIIILFSETMQCRHSVTLHVCSKPDVSFLLCILDVPGSNLDPESPDSELYLSWVYLSLPWLMLGMKA